MIRHSYLALAVFAVLVLAFPLAATNVYLVNVMVFTGINTILAVGLNVLMGYAGQISLGHAAFYGLGAYVSGVLSAKFGVPAWPAFAIAAITTAVGAYLIGVPTLRLRGHYLAIGTLGFGIIAHIFFVQLDFLTGGPSGLTGVPNLALGAFVLDNDVRYYYLVWPMVLIVMLLTLNLANSRVGRALRAIASGEIAAESMGIDTTRLRISVFVLSAVFASVAGSLYVHFITFAAPETFSVMTSVMMLIMVVVGGVGSFWGPVIGAIGLTVLPEYLRAWENLDSLLYGAVLVLVMMFMPRGLMGLFGDLESRWRR